MIWLKFIACVAAIAWGGTRLSRYGDVIAEKTGLGGNWIGLVLLATVTSLPELMTGLSAVTVANAPEIAIGDVLGSCVFNLAILVVVDFLHREAPLYTRAGHGHILSAAFGVVMIGLAGLFLLLAREGAVPSIGRVGAYTPLIVALYLLAMRMIYAYERREMARFVEAAAERYADLTLRRALAGYAIAAAVVVAAGIWLPFIGEDIAVTMGWHASFVGTLFVAAATSAPELAVTVAAVRIGALDMAVANLLGSNLFNLLIVAVDDALYDGGPILAHVTPVHAVSALTAVIMTGAAIVGLLYRPAGRVAGTVSWISVFLLGLYAVNAYVLFRYGA
ncbi:MAG: cation transporter [Rhodocyclales bacterium CG17_big_fil_post_rev_8_21_14_2_50_68_7]|nr:MAG: cation transporter [Rhodocyclales bacterium CG17_big_fil_post_rev_8_21_14_2_50_68_7]PIX74647.1 MAG: cation transporter [Rhodocyclales bacterium CG_4_10_14_3_um_filter_68_10]PJA58615.1 MAG: cation transporter [Rhodocyclales bacterium CG_4_9_14_3_um_filter_68_10]